MIHALVLSSLLLLVAGNDDVLFEESFKDKLETGWKWIREDAKEWRIGDSALHVRSQPGHIWGGNDAKNVLIFQGAITDQVEARVNVAHAPKMKWEQAGLIWYVDDDNFVKLISEQIEGKMFAVFASERGGRGTVFGKVEAPQANMQLRLLVRSKRVIGQWRIKATDAWSDCGMCEFKVKGKPYFGLFTQNGSAEVIRWVRFDSFVIARTRD
jgi:regulation of enolase protein 1 (concanavalin A-like superfamily)